MALTVDLHSQDIFDAFRLALKFYHFRDASEYD